MKFGKLKIAQLDKIWWILVKPSDPWAYNTGIAWLIVIIVITQQPNTRINNEDGMNLLSLFTLLQ